MPGDALLCRIAAGVGVEPWYFREYRERRLVEALRAAPDLEMALSRMVRDGRIGPGLTMPPA